MNCAKENAEQKVVEKSKQEKKQSRKKKREIKKQVKPKGPAGKKKTRWPTFPMMSSRMIFLARVLCTKRGSPDPLPEERDSFSIPCKTSPIRSNC